MRDLKEVQSLLAQSKDNQARLLIDSILSFHESDRDYYLKIVDCLVDSELYDDAINTINLYKKNTGKALHGDISLNEIKQLKKVSKDIERVDSKLIFRFLSIRERGFFSGMRRLIRISKVIIGDQGVSFCTRFGNRSYSWDRLEEAFIIKQKHGMSYYGSYTQHVLIFDFSNRKEMIDVTPAYPDYSANKLLLKQIKKYTEVKEYKNRKVFIFNWHAIFIVAPFVFLMIFMVIRESLKL